MCGFTEIELDSILCSWQRLIFLLSFESAPLVQAVENGDADKVGQAWQAVKAGAVQPDIDSLNTLLK